MVALVFVIVVIIAVTLFSVQNAMPVSISFLFWQFNASLAIIALLFFLSGMIAGIGVLSWMRIRRRTKMKKETAEKPLNDGMSQDYDDTRQR